MLLYFFLAFELHSLKKLSNMNQNRSQCNNFSHSSPPTDQNSEKIIKVSNEIPMCGVFSSYMEYNYVLSGSIFTRYHFSDPEDNGWALCNECTHVAICNCDLSVYGTLQFRRGGNFSQILRTTLGFPNGLFYLNNIQSIFWPITIRLFMCV